MEKTQYLCWFLCAVLIAQTATAHPRASPDQSTSEEDSDDDTQQQQQQNVDAEEFTGKLKTKGNPRLPTKGEKLKSEDLEDDPCLDPKKIGPCKASMPRFFFNKASGKCQTFIFGGCGANRNNFLQLTDCESTCSKHLRKASALPYNADQGSICEKAPVLPGARCRAHKPRWTYNVSLRECVQFIYGGCRGTENNFITRELCQETCGGYEKPEMSKDGDDAIEISEGTPPIPDRPELPVVGILPFPPGGESPGDKCSLPKDKGMCLAIMNKYFFNKEHNRCEKFEYGGCGGNQNRFETVEECVRACGGDTPAEDAECSNIDCPWALYTHYTTYGCKPVYDGKACCPTRFDCPDKVSSPNNNTLGEEGRSLTIRDGDDAEQSPKCSYKGKLYEVGQPVPDASDTGSCRADCICAESFGTTARPKITCASIECPENFGAYGPGKDRNCFALYKRGSCCAYDFFCPNDTLTFIEPEKPLEEPVKDSSDSSKPTPLKCEVDGTAYYEGQRFYPKKSPCLKCLCQKGFNGTLTDEFCENIDCGIEIYYSHYLAKGCAPVYFQSDDGTASCCPISWECPDDKKDPSSESLSTPTSTLPPIPSTPSLPGSASSSNGPITINGRVRPDPPPPPMPMSSSSNSYIRSGEACQLPKVEGKCKGSRPRFFYNSETNACESFSYTGCGGNENNFVSISDCQKLCNRTSSSGSEGADASLLGRSLIVPVPQSSNPSRPRSIQVTEVDPCTMPIRRGNCRGYFPRWFYSPETNSCQLFIFGGCRGNRNNFYSKDSCEATCTNSIPVESLRTSIPASPSSSGGGDSSMVKFGEDEDNSNAPSKSDSESNVDPCSLPAQRGPCKDVVRRFFYNSETKECRVFVYGGCSGNSNNFISVRDCRQRCIPRDSNNNDNGGSGSNTGGDETSRSGSQPPPLPPPGPSQIPDETNPNGSSQQQRPPASTYLERCRLPKKSGTCLGIIPSFYFNAETGACTQFYFSGCFGNANRFSSLEECETICKSNPTDGENPEGTTVTTTGGQDGIIGGRMSTPWRRPTGINRENDDVEINLGPGNPPRPRPDGNRNRPNPDSEVDNEKGMCNLAPAQGSCKSHSLRYHWDSTKQTCLPFVYSGCRGNKNNFLTESDCLSTCGSEPTIEQLTSEGVLSCTFGNETLPLGSIFGGGARLSPDSPMPCGVPVCQCVTPPSVTCIQTQCPPPIMDLAPALTLEKSCPSQQGPSAPSYTCDLSRCEETQDEDGCKVCSCLDGEDSESQQIQVEDTFVKSVKG